MNRNILEKAVVVPAPCEEVWRAWTTSEGAQSFFAPKANIELKMGGAYEILFDLDAPEGSQGSEGMTILSYLPGEMLSFTWNAPPEIPEVRVQKAFVVVRLIPESDASTRVKLAHLGWGRGKAWDRTYAYFDRAWDIVMTRLKTRFESGPVDWSGI